MQKCSTCHFDVELECADFVTCPILDATLGPVKVAKRKRANQCAFREGCKNTRAYNSAYCINHRNEMHNLGRSERLDNKREGTK